MKQKPRTLESFSKEDLITLIRKRWFRVDESIRDLVWIEYERVTAALSTKTEALLEQMKACKMPHDWDRYKVLSAKHSDLQKKWDRANHKVDV